MRGKRRTTVSVTKGIGNALLGGLGGGVFCVGGRCGRFEKHRTLDREICRRVRERVARNIDLDKESIAGCDVVRKRARVYNFQMQRGRSFPNSEVSPHTSAAYPLTSPQKKDSLHMR